MSAAYGLIVPPSAATGEALERAAGTIGDPNEFAAVLVPALFDPFHVVALAGRAVDDERRAERNARASRHPQGRVAQERALGAARRARTDRPPMHRARPHPADQRSSIPCLAAQVTAPRALLDEPDQARAHLNASLTWPSRSEFKPFIRIARTLAATAMASSPRSHSDSPTPTRGRAQQGSPALSPQLRVSLPRTLDPHLPLLRRDHHQPAAPISHSNARSAQQQCSPPPQRARAGL